MISKKTTHAIEVCVWLAGQRKGAYSTTTELSPRLGLSISYLENIFKTLKDHQLVTSMKGPGGGYRISKDPALVSMWEVAAAFETLLTHDVESATPDCLAYEFELERVIKNTLSSFTLSDFADATQSQQVALGDVIGRFKFKPLAAPFIPKAPNSVFQLHMSF